MKHYLHVIVLSCMFFLGGCGFHLQGPMPLAMPLHRLYLDTPDPYGHLARNLQGYLKMSDVELMSSPSSANTILKILRDENSQELLSVNGTQQTRQYNLKVTVEFEITNTQGVTLLPTQTLTEGRTITIQSDQILGSSNEATLYYQQMRRALAYAMMNRIASREVTQMLDKDYPSTTTQP